jgi:hypothetical protein
MTGQIREHSVHGVELRVCVGCLPLMRIAPAADGDEAAHWRQCATEARRSAEEGADQIAKKTLTDIADAYEQLAALADAKLAAKK